MASFRAKTVFVMVDDDGKEGTTHYDSDLDALAAAYDQKFREFFSDLRGHSIDASDLIQHDRRLPGRCVEWLALVNDLYETGFLNRVNRLLYDDDTLQYSSWGSLIWAIDFIHTNQTEFAKIVEEYQRARSIRGVPMTGDGSVRPATPEHTRALDMGEDNDGRSEEDNEPF